VREDVGRHKPYVEAGESAVGTRVEIRHLAPTPIGMRVVGKAEVLRGRRSAHRACRRATDDAEEIGAGTHERVMVDLARLTSRLDAKRTS